jgi:hypothetical protein
MVLETPTAPHSFLSDWILAAKHALKAYEMKYHSPLQRRGRLVKHLRLEDYAPDSCPAQSKMMMCGYARRDEMIRRTLLEENVSGKAPEIQPLCWQPLAEFRETMNHSFHAAVV